ncbi:MAG TPA: FAD-binding oxidoreductase [Methylomirabilota bacterium]|nr:FAD-binding oxidoreductase [Methylomirabilota bacterium]
MSPTPPRAADIVIIGAGAIGASIAYHLARRGARDVVVLERDTVGAGSTSKAAGGIRVQFGTRVEIEFSRRGLAFFQRFEDEMGVPCDFHQEGYLFVVTDEPTLARFRANVALQQSLGADVQIITPDDARALVPSLVVDDVLAAVWGPRDGYASPNDVVQAYAAQARARGVRILEGTPVTGLRVERGRVTAVETPAGAISTRLVVNAAGPWAPLVGRMAGLQLPVDPRRRHIFVTDAFDGVRHPLPLVTDTGSGFYCRSEQGAILMSPGDIGAATAYEAEVDWSALEGAVEKAVRRIPALEGARVRHAWAGLRPLTPDGRAILDWAPGIGGLFLAVGFCGHGFQHSPAVGETVSEWLLDGRPRIDCSDLRLSRFPAA